MLAAAIATTMNQEKTLIFTPLFAFAYFSPIAGIMTLAMETNPITNETQFLFPVSGAMISQTKPKRTAIARARMNFTPSIFISLHFSKEKKFINLWDLGSGCPSTHAGFPYQGFRSKEIILCQFYQFLVRERASLRPVDSKVCLTLLFNRRGCRRSPLRIWLRHNAIDHCRHLLDHRHSDA